MSASRRAGAGPAAADGLPAALRHGSRTAPVAACPALVVHASSRADKCGSSAAAFGSSAAGLVPRTCQHILHAAAPRLAGTRCCCR